jgi:hypothetical protein
MPSKIPSRSAADRASRKSVPFQIAIAWPFGDGTPPHETAGDIFARPDAEEFERCFVDSLGLKAPFLSETRNFLQ